MEPSWSSVALPTALMIIAGGGMCRRTRVFLDSGSQRSSISSRLSNEMNLHKLTNLPIELQTFAHQVEHTSCDLIQCTLTLGDMQLRVMLPAQTGRLIRF